ncbi:MAG: hypothetical protein K2I23_07655, partial [Clostridia bacterium]|nr:hypothetical protein [Clostridia bacterium]
SFSSSADVDSYYWLRSPGRYASYSYALFVHNSGNIHATHGSLSHQNGVRPAFSFSPSNVIYATAASVASNGATFASVSSVGGKPAYKLYIKSNGYKNFNDSANSTGKPQISTDGGKITVTKSGQTGSAVILLSDKSGSGSVAYQATAPFSGGVATANLPSGVDASDFSITVLFADSLRGGQYAETITGSFTSFGLAIPEDVPVVYNGALRTVADFSEEKWYDASIYQNSTLMTVSIPSNAITVDEYTVSFTLKDSADIEWSDGTKGTKEITLKITQKELSVDIDWEASPPTPTPTGICENDKTYEDQILRVKYTDDKGNPPFYTEPTKVGNYYAVVEFNPAVTISGNYVLDDTYDKTINIGTKSITAPTLNHLTQEYNGSNRTFELEYAQNTASHIEVTLANNYGGKITDAGGAYRVIQGGVYENAIKLHLTNGYDPVSGDGRDVWSDTNNSDDRYLTITVTPKALDKFVIREVSGGILNGKTESTLKVTMDYIESAPSNTDEVNYKVYAQKGSNEPIEIASGTAKGGQYSQEITLDFSKIYTDGDYTLTIKEVDSEKNYTVALSSSVTLKMTEPTGSDNLKWRLEKDGTLTFDAPVVAEIGETSKAFPTTKTYDGSAYTFNVIKPDGYEKGLVTYTKDGTPVNEMKDAGQYVATVTLSSGGATQDYTVTFEITPYKFNLNNVKWENDGKYEYTGSQITPSLTGLPSELAVKDLMGANTSGTAVKTYGEVTVTFKIADGYTESNYILPEKDGNNYDGNFTWTISWQIIPVQIKLNWEYKDAEDINDVPFRALVLSDSRVADKIDYLYYETNSSGEILDENAEGLTLDEIEVNATQVKYYKAYPVLQSLYEGDYVFPDGADLYSPVFSVGGDSTAITVSLSTTEYEYTGKAVALKWATGTPTGSLTFTYYAGDAFGVNKLDSAPKDVGTYWVEIKSNNASVVLSGDTQFQFKINKSVISTQWKTSAKPPVLGNIKSIQLKEGIEYEYYDADMHKVNYSDLSKGGTFKIRAVLKDNRNFEFDNGEVETETIEFSVAPGEELRDPSDINNPNYNFDDEENPPSKKPDITIEWDKTKNPPELKIPDEYKDKIHPEYEYFDKDGNPVKPEDLKDGEDYTVKVKIPDSEKDKFNFVDKFGNTVDPDNIPPYDFEKKSDKSGSTLDDILEKLKEIPLWQLIASVISIILIIVFLSKTAGYESKRKKFNKKADKLESSVYAGAFLGLAISGWTAIACVLMALTVVSLVIMLIAKSRCNKAEENYEEAIEERNRNKADLDDRRREEEYSRRDKEARRRDEDMRMMFMSMMGGNGNMGQGMPQGGFAFAQPGISMEDMRGLISETVTALLPGVQQALPQQASTNDELVEKLIEKTEKNEKNIQKLLEKLVDKEVAATTTVNDETVKQMMKNQEMLMEKILELSSNQTSEPQIVEKVVEVPVEKIVEVPVEVEKIVEKEVKVEVPVEVEKIVEKEVVKEVPVEVEKIVEKEVVKEVKVEVPVA